ncbi:MAG: SLC13 family permease [Caldilinea sp. CFX5]|nr:SLC13 family permease [Caldilinea sp. CFX5]
MSDQLLVALILGVALVLFIWERWRYDLVALAALLAVTLAGIVPADEAFLGFGHPAVVTVAGVLVISRALINSGAIDLLARRMMRIGNRPTIQVGALSAVTALCSAVMNNVAATALLLPLGIQMARKAGRSPSLLLMPLAYSSLLGGMLTLIGTPPNIIIATYRAETGAGSFGMFAFTPVGFGVIVVNILYLALVGWRLVPERKGQTSREALFQIKDYLTEVRVPAGSPLNGQRLREIAAFADGDVIVMGLERDKRQFFGSTGYTVLQENDILLVRADTDLLKTLLNATGFELVGNESLGELTAATDEINILEAVVTPQSPLIGRTVRDLRLRQQHNVNVLAVARRGASLRQRIRNVRFEAGDVLLLQGPNEGLYETMAALDCLPLAERNLRIGQTRRIVLAVGLFAAAIIATATGVIALPVAIVTAAVAMILTGLISLRDAYDSIEWPILILLGAMIPVADALERTGGADWIAGQLLGVAGNAPPVVALGVVLVGSMILTPLVNNAAAALLMAPIAVSIAQGLQVSPDAFLMAAAVGVSCDFLTPIGHQSNTLVMGPGGYKFSDYARVGLPIELLVIVTAIPLLLFFWPL